MHIHNLASNPDNEINKINIIVKRRMNHTMRFKYPTNSILVVGALSLLPMAAYAEAKDWPLTIKMGIGKASFNTVLNTTALTSKGYTVNSYRQTDVDENSNHFSVALKLTNKVNVELGWQALGKMKSSLDIGLPAGKTVQQAAEDIAAASPHQSSGLLYTLGANYVQPVYSRLDLRVGAGWLLGTESHRITINGEDVDVNDSSSAPFLKLGIGVKVSRGFAITAHTERYFFDDPIDRVEIGISYTTR